MFLKSGESAWQMRGPLQYNLGRQGCSDVQQDSVQQG
jgi:hypothetical protein